jgi:hypothetical protein
MAKHWMEGITSAVSLLDRLVNLFNTSVNRTWTVPVLRRIKANYREVI